MWIVLQTRRSHHRYQILAAETMEGMARRLQELYPDRFRFHKTRWGKFPDGTDNIEVCKSKEERGLTLCKCVDLGGGGGLLQ